MKKWVLLAIASFVLPIFGTVGLYLFAAAMMHRKRVVQDLGLMVTPSEMFAIESADLVARNLWSLAPGMILAGLILGCIFIALARKSRSTSNVDREHASRPQSPE